eukprot:1589369-Prymnesium_polylepis.1
MIGNSSLYAQSRRSSCVRVCCRAIADFSDVFESIVARPRRDLDLGAAPDRPQAAALARLPGAGEHFWAVRALPSKTGSPRKDGLCENRFRPGVMARFCDVVHLFPVKQTHSEG